MHVDLLTSDPRSTLFAKKVGARTKFVDTREIERDARKAGAICSISFSTWDHKEKEKENEEEEDDDEEVSVNHNS